MIYRNYEYTFAIAHYCYGNMCGWVKGAEYHDLGNAFDALDRLNKEAPLEPGHGEYYRIDLKYGKVKNEEET